MRRKTKTVYAATTQNGIRNLNAFIKLLKKKNIDISGIDLAVYDFDAFENVQDLLRHYAYRENDVLCSKLLYIDEADEMKKWEAQYHAYLDYVKNNENGEIENDGNNGIDDLHYKINLLENSVAAIQNRLEELSSLTQIYDELNTIKSQLHNLQNNDRKNEILGHLEDKLRSIEDRLEALRGPARKAKLQATLDGPPIPITHSDGPDNNMVTAKIISIIKTLVVAGILIILSKYAEPHGPIDAITGIFLVILAFASDFITSYGIYALFSGNRKATPNGMLWSRGRRFNMRR